MKFIGIDLHANRFTCCYRNGQLKAGDPNGRDAANHEGKMAQYRRFLEQQKKLAVLQKTA